MEDISFKPLHLGKGIVIATDWFDSNLNLKMYKKYYQENIQRILKTEQLETNSLLTKWV